ncbi:hypothetical protein [Actinoplanes sp. TBRC 11911]|uniref:hypothetical protein n=1 Tax=Actinoplanes sp. TBRC 11911 TaxID=2729386 RepID=UPI0037BE556C
MIAGLRTPTDGVIEWNGEPFTHFDNDGLRAWTRGDAGTSPRAVQRRGEHRHGRPVRDAEPGPNRGCRPAGRREPGPTQGLPESGDGQSGANPDQGPSPDRSPADRHRRLDDTDESRGNRAPNLKLGGPKGLSP